MTDQGRSEGPPGRPLWIAAEKKRIDEGVSKFDWVAQIGIGRRSYDRLAIQENKPITRTVKKVADRIGMNYFDAMKLAGLAPDDQGVDAILTQPDGTRVYSQVRHYTPEVERVMASLRKTADNMGCTLGDVLVLTGLAGPEELKLTTDDVVEEIENDDLPDDLKQEFLAGYRRLREEVAETARHRQGD